MPNLAARVAGLAHPGQILVEGTSGFTARRVSADKGAGGGLATALGGVGDRSFNKDAKRDDMVSCTGLLLVETQYAFWVGSGSGSGSVSGKG